MISRFIALGCLHCADLLIQLAGQLTSPNDVCDAMNDLNFKRARAEVEADETHILEYP